MQKTLPMLALAGSLGLPAFPAGACWQRCWQDGRYAEIAYGCDNEWQYCTGEYAAYSAQCRSTANDQKTACLAGCSGQSCDWCWSNYDSAIAQCDADYAWGIENCESQFWSCCGFYDLCS
jgi:hypothetical protein